MFIYTIPEHTLAEWKAQVIVDSQSHISLAIATVNAILASLENIAPPPNLVEPTHHSLGGKESILSLANDLQNMLGDAMALATSMFPKKSTLRARGTPSPTTFGQNWSSTIYTPSADTQKPSAASQRFRSRLQTR
jgi:hypothetical protein